MLRPVAEPFSGESELRRLKGNLGQAILKISAVSPEHRVITANAHVFDAQGGVIAAFKANRFVSDRVVIVRNRGPRACGMPELHQLMTALSALLDRLLKVALVTSRRKPQQASR